MGQLSLLLSLVVLTSDRADEQGEGVEEGEREGGVVSGSCASESETIREHCPAATASLPLPLSLSLLLLLSLVLSLSLLSSLSSLI